MSSSPRTEMATEAAQDLIYMRVNRRLLGLKNLVYVLAWAAINGQITEPECHLLLGRAGKLNHYAKQGYFERHNLPPGLKAAPHFPHLHYFHVTDKGMLLLLQYYPHLCGYGNLEIRQRLYLHDFICRIEAMWRFKTCKIDAFIPESRLPELSSPNHKQHDGHFILRNGRKVGLEVEAADWKAGVKLDRFVAQCLNSVSNNRVQGILVLAQTASASRHYADPFKAGKYYFPEWIKHNGHWYPKQSSKTTISAELAAKVHVDVIRSQDKIFGLVDSQPISWLPSVAEYFE